MDGVAPVFRTMALPWAGEQRVVAAPTAEQASTATPAAPSTTAASAPARAPVEVIITVARVDAPLMTAALDLGLSTTDASTEGDDTMDVCESAASFDLNPTSAVAAGASSNPNALVAHVMTAADGIRASHHLKAVLARIASELMELRKRAQMQTPLHTRAPKTAHASGGNHADHIRRGPTSHVAFGSIFHALRTLVTSIVSSIAALAVRLDEPDRRDARAALASPAPVPVAAVEAVVESAPVSESPRVADTAPVGDFVPAVESSHSSDAAPMVDLGQSAESAPTTAAPAVDAVSDDGPVMVGSAPVANAPEGAPTSTAVDASSAIPHERPASPPVSV